MKKHVLTPLFILVFVINLLPVKAQQLLPYNGSNYFLNGVNIPWHNFDNDFGIHYQMGTHYEPDFFDSIFTECHNYGVNCVRVWLHNDGATSPEFDTSGFVTGLDTNFFSQLDNFFQLAANHNIMVIPSIWSFPMMNNNYALGIYGGMHANMIQDTLHTKSYINNVLIPMVNRYANQCNLLAWEIINEPEWATDVQGNDPNITQHVTMTEMQRFVGLQAEAIHQHSTKMCTVGAVAMKYNSDVFTVPTLCVGNFWTDAAIQAAYNKPLARLDFYQVHYYDWMHTIYQNFDPYDHAYSYWNLDKPMIIGESKGTSSNHTPQTQLYNAFIGNFSGVLFWSFIGGDSNGDFNTVKNDLLAFRNAASTLVDFSGCMTTDVAKTEKLDEIKLYPNPFFTNKVELELVTTSEISIFNTQGQIIKEIKNANSHQTIDLNGLSQGVYLFKITNEKGTITKRVIKQ